MMSRGASPEREKVPSRGLGFVVRRRWEKLHRLSERLTARVLMRETLIKGPPETPRYHSVWHDV